MNRLTFVLIPGAGGSAWYWHLVEPELRERGYDVVAVDLPASDDSAGLPQYVGTVIKAIADRTDLVLVAQSLAGFTAPLVCTRVPVRTIDAKAARRMRSSTSRLTSSRRCPGTCSTTR